MIKVFFTAVFFFFSTLALACNRAAPTDSPQFCTSFKAAASCYCTSSGLPTGMCQDMNALYSRMLFIFGTLQRACEYQKYTSTQDCIDNWNCYLRGGIDSKGKLCNGTKRSCL